MKRTRIRQVSAKRAAANAEYMRRRKVFLEKHPYCQAHMVIYGMDEAEVIKKNGWGAAIGDYHKVFGDFEVPRSNQIHHAKKPKATYLNDESTWFAVCDYWHLWIEDNKGLAREKGLLQDNH